MLNYQRVIFLDCQIFPNFASSTFPARQSGEIDSVYKALGEQWLDGLFVSLGLFDTGFFQTAILNHFDFCISIGET